MGTPEFPDLGKHCSVEECRLVDFLPFNCDRCHQVFCLEHRTYSRHKCANESKYDVTVIVCPMCAKGVRLVPDEDPNVTWEKHMSADCDPSNYDKVMKKPRCPAPGCKETLTFASKFKCRDCLQEVCLRHRFGPDHKCPGPKKVESGFTFSGIFGKHLEERIMPNVQASKNTISSTSRSFTSGLFAAASNLKASAEAGFSKLSQAITSSSQTSMREKTEDCPRCGLKFESVVSLVDHVEKFHEGGPKAGSPELPDVCPRCGRCFSDSVSLVNHVEVDHGGSSFS